MRYSLLLFSFFLTFCVLGQSQTEVGKALETANTDQLHSYFKETIDLDIPNSKGTFNKKQASIVLKKFFQENPPSKYFLKHQGGGNNKALFEIGSLITAKKKYRTYLLYNIVGKTPQIIELRIELEE